MTRGDRFVRIYAWLGIAGGLIFALSGIWVFWIAQSSVPLGLGLLTLASSIALRRKHERLRGSERERMEEAGPPLSRG